MRIKYNLVYWTNRILVVIVVILILAIGLYIDFFVGGVAKKIHHTKTALKWSQSSKDSLKNQMMGRPDLRNINVPYRAAFCDCLIRKIEQSYPGGYYITIDTVKINEMNEYCLDSITFKKALGKDTGKVFKNE